ncbi:MAG: insulinase family protein [Proteobacteria bacterium]|nr:insulinase family protein [Pseudomonadota bacterium]
MSHRGVELPSHTHKLRPPLRLAGPRGSRLIIDRVSGIPLVWFQVAIAGGSASDAEGCEGFTNHMAGLARRGAGSRDRRALDQELDLLGASLQLTADRDSVKLTGLCLRRNLDRVLALAADTLARPHMAQSEHEKLLRETRMSLDEYRDDDSILSARFFNRHCVPGHPYARSVAGTEVSLARIELDAIQAAYRAMTVPKNLIVGFAGDLDSGHAEELAAELTGRLIADLPDHPAPPMPDVSARPRPRGRRLIVVDKPERTQAQIVVGHIGPRHGSEDSLAFSVAETAFGGLFTSRLMQKIRVERGWSYGASCTLYRSRGPHWFLIQLAPSAEVAPQALSLVLDMFEDLAQSGITEDELSFTKSYLLGSLPFRLATARQRARIAVQDQLFGLPHDYTETLPERLEQVTLDEVNRVCQTWLHSDDALSVVVASADTMVPQLENIGAGTPVVVPFDSY